jgi:hypothetical protein
VRAFGDNYMIAMPVFHEAVPLAEDFMEAGIFRYSVRIKQ